MRKLLTCLLLTVSLPGLSGLTATSARAATVLKAYVTTNGTDTGTCGTVATACKTLQYAHDQVIAGGAIECISPYDTDAPVTINRSITIDCGSPQSSFVDDGLGAITISAGVVTIRNLTMNGEHQGGGTNPAINFTGGTALFVENCIIEHFEAFSAGVGINFVPNAVAAQLQVTNSIVKNNGNAAGGAISIAPAGGGAARVVIENTQIKNNYAGVVAVGTNGLVLVDIKNSTVAKSAANGVSSLTAGSVVSIVLEHSESIYNGTSGIFAQGSGAYVSLNGSTVAWNATGLNASSGGLILSYQNNLIAGNPNPGVTPMSFSLQ